MKIDHVGIAVQSIAESLGFYTRMLGLECTNRETVVEEGVHVAVLPIGESRIELLEPTSPSSPIARFLERRGEGLHHICIEVKDLTAALSQLQRSGIRLINETARPGALNKKIAFIHPSAANGVLVELTEEPRV